LVPDWSSDLVRVIKCEYPDGDSDPFVYTAWLLAAYLSGVEDARDFPPLLKELRQTVAFLDSRGKSRPRSSKLGELRARPEVGRQL
jgi:hypothetical protein